MKELQFIGTFLGVIFCSLLFSSIFPGGDQETKIIWGSIAILASVIVVCTKVVVEKLDELKKCDI